MLYYKIARFEEKTPETQGPVTSPTRTLFYNLPKYG